MSSMVPRQRRFSFVAGVVESQLVFDFFVRFAAILMKTFVTRAIRGRVMFVSITGLHKRLLFVLFTPIFFFTCCIHNFSHPVCTIRRGEAADNCSNCGAYRPSNGCAYCGAGHTAARRSQADAERMCTLLPAGRVAISRWIFVPF